MPHIVRVVEANDTIFLSVRLHVIYNDVSQELKGNDLRD